MWLYLLTIVVITIAFTNGYFSSCWILLCGFFICPSRSILFLLYAWKSDPYKLHRQASFPISFLLSMANKWHRRSEGRKRPGFSIYALPSAVRHKVCMNNKQACHTLQIPSHLSKGFSEIRPRRWAKLFNFHSSPMHWSNVSLILLFLPPILRSLQSCSSLAPLH